MTLQILALFINKDLVKGSILNYLDKFVSQPQSSILGF